MDVFWVDSNSLRPEIGPYVAAWVETTREPPILGIAHVPGTIFSGEYLTLFRKKSEYLRGHCPYWGVSRNFRTEERLKNAICIKQNLKKNFLIILPPGSVRFYEIIFHFAVTFLRSRKKFWNFTLLKCRQFLATHHQDKSWRALSSLPLFLVETSHSKDKERWFIFRIFTARKLWFPDKLGVRCFYFLVWLKFVQISAVWRGKFCYQRQCFLLSSTAADGKSENGLKHEKIGQVFQVLKLCHNSQKCRHGLLLWLKCISYLPL